MVTQDTLTVWESVSAVAQVGLLFVASLGLRQLRLAREGLKQSGHLARTSALRDSYRIAAEQVLVYAKQIIPLINQCDLVLGPLGLNAFLDSFIVKVEKDRISVAPPRQIPPDFDFKQMSNAEVVSAFLEVHNALEAFAVMFTNGVASENVAFCSVGRSYCHTVKRHAPFIVPTAGQGDYPGSGHHQNVLRLFLIWQLRLDHLELVRQKDELSKKLEVSRTVKIEPIGTE